MCWFRAGLNKVELVSTNEITESQPYTELSTVFFYEESAPRVIALKDCTLPIPVAMDRAISAFFGQQGKQAGFMAARAYADKHRLQYTIIDFVVKLDHKQNPLWMKPDDLSQHDFLSLSRAARGLRDVLGELLEAQAMHNGMGAQDQALSTSDPLLFLRQHPEFMPYIMDHPEWQHLKVITYAAQLDSYEKPINIGVIPFRHWGAVDDAACRFDPTIRITLDLPDESKPLSVSASTEDRARTTSMRAK